MNLLLKKWRNVALGLSFFTAASSVLAAEPLVDAAWAKANAGKPGVVFIDFQPATDFMRGHIPGAVNSNFAKDGWRAERASDKVPDMLGEPNKLAELIGKLGYRQRYACCHGAPGGELHRHGRRYAYLLDVQGTWPRQCFVA